jgi:hypothetical protein
VAPRFGEVGTEGEGSFVVHLRLTDGGEVMPGDADLVQGGSIIGGAAVGVDGLDEFAAGEKQVAGVLGQKGAGGGIGGSRSRGLRSGGGAALRVQEKGGSQAKLPCNQPSIEHGRHLREPSLQPGLSRE